MPAPRSLSRSTAIRSASRRCAFSVLTRLPGERSIDAPTAQSIIATVFPAICWLEHDAATKLLQRLGVIGVSGGAVYGALIGEAARVSERRLLTRDLRAQRTYGPIGVDYELIGP